MGLKAKKMVIRFRDHSKHDCQCEGCVFKREELKKQKVYKQMSDRINKLKQNGTR